MQTLHTLMRTASSSDFKKEIKGRLDEIDMQSSSGETALFLAIRLKRTDLVCALIKSGASLSVTNKEEQTALHVAVQLKDTRSTRLFAHNGAAINAQDRYGDTPLMIAVRSKDAHFVRKLLKYGANPSCPNYALMTPLAVARKLNSEVIVEMLISAHAQVARSFMQTCFDAFLASPRMVKFRIIAFNLVAHSWAFYLTYATRGALSQVFYMSICSSVGYISIEMHERYRDARWQEIDRLMRVSHHPAA